MQAPRTTTQLEVATGTNATKTKIDEEEQKQRAFRQSQSTLAFFSSILSFLSNHFRKETMIPFTKWPEFRNSLKGGRNDNPGSPREYARDDSTCRAWPCRQPLT